MPEPTSSSRDKLPIFLVIAFILGILYFAVDKLTTDEYFTTQTHSGYVVQGPHQLNWAERVFPYGICVVLVVAGFAYFIYHRFIKQNEPDTLDRKDKSQ